MTLCASRLKMVARGHCIVKLTVCYHLVGEVVAMNLSVLLVTKVIEYLIEIGDVERGPESVMSVKFKFGIVIDETYSTSAIPTNPAIARVSVISLSTTRPGACSRTLKMTTYKDPT